MDIPINIQNGDFEIPILVEPDYSETVHFWNDAGIGQKQEADRSGEWMPGNFSQMLRLENGSVYQDLRHNWISTDQYTLAFHAFEVGWTAQPGETGEAVTVQLCQTDDAVLWSEENIPLDQTLSGDLNTIAPGPASHEFSFKIDASSFTAGTEGSTLRLRFLESGTDGAIWIDDITLMLHLTVLPDASELLACHWMLDETTGTAAWDSSGNGKHGTVNGTTFDAGSSPGKVGRSLYFAGNNGGGNDWITESTSEGNWSAYSISLWAKAEVTGQANWVSVFNNSRTSGIGFQIDVDGGAPGNYRYHGSLDVNFGPVTTDWIHLAAVCDGSSTRLFYNGNHVRTASVADTTFHRLELGVNRSHNQRFRGHIDDFQIYHAALSDSEILHLYQNPGSTISGPETTLRIFSFHADDGYIESPTVVTLKWQVLGADSITIDQGVGDVTALTSAEGIGSTTVTVSQTTTFNLTAANREGVETEQVTVTAGPARPNIILFLVDDMGTQDTSVPFFYVNGAPRPTVNNTLYRTPGMERLADSGMKFTSCYAMPVCSPTRVCLMTGLNSFRHGVTDWIREDGSVTHTRNHRDLDPPKNWLGTGILPSHIPLSRVLRDAGYSTIFSGKAHLGSQGSHGEFPDSLGFDVNIAGYHRGHPPDGYYNYSYMPLLSAYSAVPTNNTGIYLTETLTCEAKKYVKKAVGDGKPFFLFMSHYAVHSPFNYDPRFGANYPSLSGNQLNFATMIEGMDKSLGDLIDTLEALEVAEDTLIIFLGDNGSDNPRGGDFNSAPLRGKKGNKYEGGVRVPLLISWAMIDPANPFQQALAIPPGSVQEDLVACFDLFPTILDIAGVSITHEIDGHTLMPYLKDQPGSHRPQEILIHYPHDHNSDYFTIYRKGDYKLIYSYDENSITDTFDAENDDNRITPKYELYNLASDIGEQRDLSRSDPERVKAMAHEIALHLDTDPNLWPVLEGTSTEAPIDSNLLLPQEFQRGDANTDTIRDISDTIKVLSYLFVGDSPPPCLDAADANDDGQLDIGDPLKILWHLFGGAGDLPPPFATCGPDPTEDDLPCESFKPCD